MRSHRAARVTALLASAALVVVLACVGASPAGATADGVWDYRSASVSGTYEPLVGYFDTDNFSDILWYAPGPAADTIWFGSATRGVFRKVSISISGTYRPILGNFAGDNRTDILWYAPGSAADTLWVATGSTGTFTSMPLTINGTFTPLVLTDTGGRSDIFWYAPGRGADALWHFSDDGSGAHTSISYSVNSTYKPVVGHWNADGLDDIFWYAPGTAPDTIWLATTLGGFNHKTVSVNGTYAPVPIYRDASTDGVHWNAPGVAPDTMSVVTSSSTLQAVNMAQGQVPPGCSWLPGTSQATIVYCANDVDAVVELDGLTATAFLLSETHDVGQGFEPFLGDFDGDGFVDLFWYAPGTHADQIWYTDSGGSTSTRAGVRHPVRYVGARG